MNVDTLISVNCERSGVALRKSLILHRQVVLGILNERLFGQGMIVGYCYVCLVYDDLCHKQNIRRTYGEQFMEVKKETFQIWANHLNAKVVNRDIVENDVCIVPGPFRAMHYINGGRYLPMDEPLE